LAEGIGPQILQLALCAGFSSAKTARPAELIERRRPAHSFLEQTQEPKRKQKGKK